VPATPCVLLFEASHKLYCVYDLSMRDMCVIEQHQTGGPLTQMQASSLFLSPPRCFVCEGGSMVFRDREQLSMVVVSWQSLELVAE